MLRVVKEGCTWTSRPGQPQTRRASALVRPMLSEICTLYRIIDTLIIREIRYLGSRYGSTTPVSF